MNYGKYVCFGGQFLGCTYPLNPVQGSIFDHGVGGAARTHLGVSCLYVPVLPCRKPWSCFKHVNKSSRLFCGFQGAHWPQSLVSMIGQSPIKFRNLSKTTLFFLYFALQYDWSRKLAPPSHPVRRKTKTIITTRSLALQAVSFFYSELSFAPRDICLALIGCCGRFSFGLTTLENRKALYFVG